MKRKISLINKIKLFMWWLNETGKSGLIEHCQFCNSIEVKINESWDNNDCYGAEYECLKCGAKGKAHEQWKR